jgi:hypothetical protein
MLSVFMPSVAMLTVVAPTYWQTHLRFSTYLSYAKFHKTFYGVIGSLAE